MTPKVVDLFCGAGGLTRGFYDEGFLVVAGIDVDASAKYAYEANNDSVFIEKDITSLTAEYLNRLFEGASVRILAGCAPCQPFSSYTQGIDHDEAKRWELLNSFKDLIQAVQPEIVTMENVSRLRSHKNFEVFVDTLRRNEYEVWHDVVSCADYGVPQTRRRLVLLASKLGQIKLMPALFKKSDWPTVRSAIESLPDIEAGESYPQDPLHRSTNMSEKNKARLTASKPGSTWKSWPEELRADCHKKESCTSYISVYGRMEWDKPSPTLTTQCYGIGHGRFGHPSQLRAISLREAALLQTFPADYKFVKPGDPVSFSKLGRLIGNAVPVALGRAVARSIKSHLTALHQ